MLGDSLQPRRNWPNLNSTWPNLGYNPRPDMCYKMCHMEFFALLGWITVPERKENGFCSILCTRSLLHEDGADGGDGFSLVDALSNTRDDLARGKEHDTMLTWAHTFSSSTGFYNKRSDRRRWQCWFGGVGVQWRWWWWWWWWARPTTACGDEEDWKKVRGSISWLLLLFRLLLCYSFFFFFRDSYEGHRDA